MEIEDKQNNATEISRGTRQSHLDSHLDLSSPAKSPGNSPTRSSISSDPSSLSHGIISPTRDEAPVADSPPHRVSYAAARPPATMNRYVVEEPVPIKKTDRGAQDGFVSVEEGQGRKRRGEGPTGSGTPSAAASARRTEKEAVVKKAAFGFRIFEFLFCLVSLSVMATDKNKGWAIDSFYRYKEFRYCISVNVIGFAYSGVQGCNLAYQLATGDYVSRRRLWYYLDFALDQMLTYLLISASSSAATRVDDWESNWGKDKFPEMASASVGLSFVAFLAFTFSSLISGYAVCGLRST